MVRPPSSQEDSLSSDATNTSLSTESGEFIISPSPHATDISSNRNPFIEQYLNIYYKKILDQSVNEFLIFLF